MSDITTKTESELTNDLQNNMANYQTTTGFPIGDFFVAIAMVLETLWDAIAAVYNMLMDLSNWPLELLKIFCYERRNIKYKEASVSSDYLTVKGDFSLSVGDLFQTDGGIIFKVTAAIEDTKGVASVPVECTTAGVVGNVAANTIVKMPVTLTGVTSVTNESAFTNGYDEEGKAAYLERYYNDLRKPITSANIYHYESWATSITGVKKARVLSCWNGANTVKVIIINSNSQPASDELVATVQKYIDPNSSGTGAGQAPVGAYCTVVSATSLDINVSATITYETGADKTTVNNTITANISSYLAEIAFDKTYVSYAKIGTIILETDGVEDYSSLLINSGGSNVSIADTQVAVLKTTTFTAA